MSERYDRIDFVNAPDTSTPVNATNLGHMEDGIESVDNEATVIEDTIGYIKKNLIPYPYDETTATRYGITWNAQSDGTVIANGTCNATGTSYSHFQIQVRAETEESSFKLKKGKYIVSGAPKGGSSSKWQITVGHTNPIDGTPYISDANDFGDGATFELAQDIDAMQVQLVIRPGQTVSNMIFRPMIRRASISDDTYESYIPSVDDRLKEIEEKISQILA